MYLSVPYKWWKGFGASDGASLVTYQPQTSSMFMRLTYLSFWLLVPLDYWSWENKNAININGKWLDIKNGHQVALTRWKYYLLLTNIFPFAPWIVLELGLIVFMHSAFWLSEWLILSSSCSYLNTFESNNKYNVFQYKVISITWLAI